MIRLPLTRRLPSLIVATLVSTVVLTADGAENTVIADKTLVVWAAPANLAQHGGSALTVEKSGGVFDAIHHQVGMAMATDQFDAVGQNLEKLQRNVFGCEFHRSPPMMTV